MPQITTNDLKNGITLSLSEGLFSVTEFQHVNPGKGAAFVRTKLKNVSSGAVLSRTFRAGEKVEQAIIDQREMQMLYHDQDNYVFMDSENFEQIEVPGTVLGDVADYLVANMTASVHFHETDIVAVELPASVELAVTEAEAAIQGNRVTGGTKSATLETGKVIKVPLFVATGDRVKVDTRNGAYITRV